MQTYRTLLASVEYARLPEGLEYDEVRGRFVVGQKVGNERPYSVACPPRACVYMCVCV